MLTTRRGPESTIVNGCERLGPGATTGDLGRADDCHTIPRNRRWTPKCPKTAIYREMLGARPQEARHGRTGALDTFAGQEASNQAGFPAWTGRSSIEPRAPIWPPRLIWTPKASSAVCRRAMCCTDRRGSEILERNDGRTGAEWFEYLNYRSGRLQPTGTRARRRGSPRGGAETAADRGGRLSP